MSDVVVVGAGPTGLWLAGELRLGGATVTVLEEREHRNPHSKALTIHPRTIEILDSRGVADPFLAEGIRIPNGHFAGLPDRMDFSVLETPYPFTLAVPQARTEELLERRARELGAVIRRGCRVTSLTAEGVRLSSGERVDAAFVVGCDGTRSVVREAAGIEFCGTEATTWGWLGDVVLDAPPSELGTTVRNAEGFVMVVPLPGGLHRLVGSDPASNQSAYPGELTLDDLRETVRRIAGTDFGMRDAVWLSRFSNETRQATSYRRGNVLLAGDAAHMHFPAGGVGMNVGIQDAHNLGWKLAGVATGKAASSLLDSYERERRPIGVDLLEHTRAQTALMTAFNPEGDALRTVVSELIATVPDVSRFLAGRLSGLSVAYTTGQRAPNLSLPDGGTLFERLRTGAHVETDMGLVRPDGHFA